MAASAPSLATGASVRKHNARRRLNHRSSHYNRLSPSRLAFRVEGKETVVGTGFVTMDATLGSVPCTDANAWQPVISSCRRLRMGRDLAAPAKRTTVFAPSLAVADTVPQAAPMLSGLFFVPAVLPIPAFWHSAIRILRESVPETRWAVSLIHRIDA